MSLIAGWQGGSPVAASRSGGRDLFLADNAAAKVFAVDVADPGPAGEPEPFEWRTSTRWRFWLRPSDVVIRDMAVHRLQCVPVPGEHELRDASRRRLTVLLDPARIKRGLAGHREAGYPLRPGEPFRLVVDSGFRDAQGLPLRAGAHRRYGVGGEERRHVDPASWVLTVPPAGTSEPLQVAFGGRWITAFSPAACMGRARRWASPRHPADRPRGAGMAAGAPPGLGTRFSPAHRRSRPGGSGRATRSAGCSTATSPVPRTSRGRPGRSRSPSGRANRAATLPRICRLTARRPTFCGPRALCRRYWLGYRGFSGHSKYLTSARMKTSAHHAGSPTPRKKSGRRCRIEAEVFVAGVRGRPRGAPPRRREPRS